MALTKASRSMLNTGIADSSDATALTFSSSEDATFAGHIVLADNKKIKFGDSTDYHISHNSNGHTYVSGSSVRHGSNAFRVMNLADSETQIEALADGAVTLYYNGNAKIATANDGIDVTGKIDCTTFESTGAATVGGNLTVTGNLQVDGTTTTINSTTYTVDDLNITLASGAGSSSAADGAGITIDGASATWNYTHSNTSWTANKNVRAPRFLTTSNSSSNFYSVLATRSGSGTSNPDIYGSSNTLVLGYSDSGKAVHFNSTGATFTGTISSGAITSTGTLGITGAISSGADTTLATFGRSGSAVSSSIIYADATTDMEFGTTTGHALSLITGDTRRLTIDNSGNATFSANLIVNGNTTLGNADTDTVTVPGPLAVDTDTLYVDVTNDRVGINVGTSPSTPLHIAGRVRATTDPTFEVYESSTKRGGVQWNTSSDYLNIFSVGGDIVFDTNGGKVGIGTATPAAALEVVRGSAGYAGIFGAPQGSGRVILFKDNHASPTKYNWLVGSQYNTNNAFEITPSTVVGGYTFNAPAITVLETGKVGIGTTNPAQNFVVAEGTNQHGIELAPGTLSYIQAYDRATSDYGNLKIDAEFIAFGTGNGTERMRILADGKIGIGTATPDVKLEIAETASDTGVQLKLNGNRSSNGNVGDIVFENASDSVAMIRANRVGGNNDAADMLFYTQATGGSNAERMRITSTGNVGIGVDPGYKLHVKTTSGGGTWPVRVEASPNNNLLFGVYESSNGDGNNGMLYLNDGSGNTDVKISTNGDSWFKGGDVGIGTDSPTSGVMLDVRGKVYVPNHDIQAKTLLIGGTTTSKFKTQTTGNTYTTPAANQTAAVVGSNSTSTALVFSRDHQMSGFPDAVIDHSGNWASNNPTFWNDNADDAIMGGATQGYIHVGRHLESMQWKNWSGTGNYTARLYTPIVHNESNMFTLEIDVFGYSTGGSNQRYVGSGYAYSGSSLIAHGTNAIVGSLNHRLTTATHPTSGIGTVVVFDIGYSSNNGTAYYNHMRWRYRGWAQKNPQDFVWGAVTT